MMSFTFFMRFPSSKLSFRNTGLNASDLEIPLRHTSIVSESCRAIISFVALRPPVVDDSVNRSLTESAIGTEPF